jgi:uncharacterized membrane protein
MELDVLLKSLEATPIATIIAENESLFPWIESLHVFAITLVIGSIAIVDLRLMGLASLDRAVTRLARDVLPCTWAAFAAAVITGSLLFSSKAVDYAHNSFFQGKMVLLVLAGINMLIFHFFVSRDIERWATPPHPTPLPAKIAGAVSLLFWIGVVACGRWVGFTLHPILAGVG